MEMDEVREVFRSGVPGEIREREALLAFEKIWFDTEQILESGNAIWIIRVADDDYATAAEFLAKDGGSDWVNVDVGSSNTYHVKSIMLGLYCFFGIASLLGLYYGIKGFNKNRFYSTVGILMSLSGLVLSIAVLVNPFVTMGYSTPIKTVDLYAGKVTTIWHVIGLVALLCSFVPLYIQRREG